MGVDNITLAKESLSKVIKEGNFQNIMVSFSGGKDSTAVIQLLIDTLVKYNLTNIKITIISSNTKIENPLMDIELNNKIKQIATIMNLKKIKFSFQLVKPEDEHSFFYLTIGKGYSTPMNRVGRWCTKELKITPIEKIYSKINSKVLILTGVREDESSNRKNSINNFFQNEVEKKGDYIFYYAPIRYLELNEIWDYLTDFTRNDDYYLNNSSLWELYAIGKKEVTCPSYFDLKEQNIQSNCGKSRYGCYLCPLTNTSAITANFEKGKIELEPYVLLRNFYITESKNFKNRRRYNRNNSVLIKEINDPINSKIAYKLLDCSIQGNLSEFKIIKVKSKDEIKSKILTLGESYNNFLRDKKDIVFILDNKYFVTKTATLTKEFRNKFYDYVVELESKYNIQFIDNNERKLILKLLGD